MAAINECKQPAIFAIRPAFDRSLALTVASGKIIDGAKVIVAADHGYNTQRWTLISTGPYVVLRPMCCSDLVLDNVGGPHCPVDLHRFLRGNLNTMWILHRISL